MSSASKLFTDDAAWYYARYRAPYPQTLFEELITYYHLDGTGTLLDLGCGTGELLVPLTTHFERAVGVDPSPQMLSEARQRIAASDAEIELIESTAEEVLLPTSVRLTTIGTAFHWMQQPKVLSRLHPITASGGGVAVIWGSVAGWWQTPEPWQQKLKELTIQYLGAQRKAGDGTYTKYQQDFVSFEDAIRESPFKTFVVRKFSYSIVRNIDEVLGLLYSRSWAAKRYFGNRLEEFEAEFKHALLTINPSNRFEENGEIETYLLRKQS